MDKPEPWWPIEKLDQVLREDILWSAKLEGHPVVRELWAMMWDLSRAGEQGEHIRVYDHDKTLPITKWFVDLQSDDLAIRCLLLELAYPTE